MHEGVNLAGQLQEDVHDLIWPQVEQVVIKGRRVSAAPLQVQRGNHCTGTRDESKAHHAFERALELLFGAGGHLGCIQGGKSGGWRRNSRNKPNWTWVDVCTQETYFRRGRGANDHIGCDRDESGFTVSAHTHMRNTPHTHT